MSELPAFSLVENLREPTENPETWMGDSPATVEVLLEKIIQLRDEFYTYIETSRRELVLQAREYERRLADLNHENERINEVLSESVPREVFTQNHKSELEKQTKTAEERAHRFGEIQKQIDELKLINQTAVGAKSAIVERRSTDRWVLPLVVSFIFSLVSAIFAVWAVLHK